MEQCRLCEPMSDVPFLDVNGYQDLTNTETQVLLNQKWNNFTSIQTCELFNPKCDVPYCAFLLLLLKLFLVIEKVKVFIIHRMPKAKF